MFFYPVASADFIPVFISGISLVIGGATKLKTWPCGNANLKILFCFQNIRLKFDAVVNKSHDLLLATNRFL